MSNRLLDQTSPYLLQHAENPVNWYPWGTEAFAAARIQDKPIFLSIGYSTCHWCHVMAHESFEDAEIAEILNAYFICVKVDKEERPDIDSIYMSVCQALTGSGGWPMSIFMTAEQKPFYAGTECPTSARYGTIGLKELLLTVKDKWAQDRPALLQAAESIVSVLRKDTSAPMDAEQALLDEAVELYRRTFDEEYGGFGNAPKFPAPHNLLFLLQCTRKHGDAQALRMTEKTLQQMYKGGLFDHIGYGFCRYSTDKYFLVPHFEKMLYDNALLILAYAKAFESTKKQLYLETAEKTADYILTEIQSDTGGFFSAQDADSDGEEGKYYLFQPGEILSLLGNADGKRFCRHFHITGKGNGNGIPNLLHTNEYTNQFDSFLPKLRAYRKERSRLHTDDKILTSWNALMISALCLLYRISRKTDYLIAAQKALQFIEQELLDGDTLYVGCRNGSRSKPGFLDDYAGYSYALLAMYAVTYDNELLRKAARLTDKTVQSFFDAQEGGFYLSGHENETLILRPKESYDGAIPSGNSLMTYNLVQLHYLLPDRHTGDVLAKQLRFMTGQAKRYPAGYSLFLMALSDYLEPPTMVTVVGKDGELTKLPFQLPSDTLVRILTEETPAYRMINGQTTYYVCKEHSCQPPVNKDEFLKAIHKSDA